MSPNDVVNKTYPTLKYTARTSNECVVACYITDVHIINEFMCQEKCPNNVATRFRATDQPECRVQCAASEYYYQTNDTEFVCITQCSNSITNPRSGTSSPFTGFIYTQITDATGASTTILDANVVTLNGLNKKCTNTCAYAYEVHDGINLCVNKCSATKYLTKDSDNQWICSDDCANNQKFYFVNSTGDKECTPSSTEAIGCKLDAANGSAIHRLAADDTNVTHLVYHVVDPNESSKRICRKTCDNGYFQEGNKFCLDHCKNSNHFRERVKLIGENGLNQNGANYYQCSMNACMNDTYFRVELVTLDNVCMIKCADTDLNSFSLTRSVSRVSNGETMHQCVQFCENNEVFIADFDLGVSGYDHTKYNPLVCVSQCPSAANPANNVIPHLVIRNTLKATITAANNFYSVDRRYCTPSCLVAGNATGFESIVVNTLN
jgi:hypothetical protein